ncbi:MAG: HlyD family secretion protein, partial [Alphaproteobacteria bacterium]|nr:HlyD family secretion protein [Alphaproteobacteria bacterium]
MKEGSITAAEAVEAGGADAPTEAATAPAQRRRPWRLVLMLSVPLLILVGGLYLWLTSGRYVSTDNAYV